MGDPRVLWIGESPVRDTGLGRVNRQILELLCGRYDVACLAWFHEPDRTAMLRGRYRIYGATDGRYGAADLDAIIRDFRPEAIVAVGDPWMVEWLFQGPPAPGRIGYVTLDGEPLAPQWRGLFERMRPPVVCSRFAERVAREGGYSGPLPVIPFGVDPAAFRPIGKGALPGAPPHLREKFVVGYVGRNQPRKQLPVLAKAFARFAEGKEDVFLYLHTTTPDVGWDLPALFDRCGLHGKAGITAKLHPVRGVNDDALSRIYNLFDVFVLPSTGEGFGLPILEAMACGVPVVATDCSAITELVEGRGELVRVKEWMTVGPYNVEQAVPDADHLAEALEKLYRDSDLRARHAASGRAFAEQTTWEHCANAWDELLCGCMEEQAAAVAPVIGPAVRAAPSLEGGNGRIAWPVRIVPPPRSAYERLSVVIAVHGQRALTEQCLRTLQADVPEAEVIVVDNGSPDDTRAWLASQSIRVVAFDENRGVPAAWNAGLAAATGDLLCVLNNDTNIHPGGMRSLAEAAWRVGIAAFQGGLFAPDLRHRGMTRDAGAADYADGCALAFRRDVWERVGTFDEGFEIAYCEDADWAFRARCLGYGWDLCPNALAHIGSRTAATVPGVVDARARNWERLRRRWAGKGAGERILVRGWKAPEELRAAVPALAALRAARPLARIHLQCAPDITALLDDMPDADLVHPGSTGDYTDVMSLDGTREDSRHAGPPLAPPTPTRTQGPATAAGMGDCAAIITCHNYARFLGECLESCLRQTRPFEHIVVVDDASSDETPAVCARYRERGVHYLRTEFRDVARARNAGVGALPRTRFLLFVDADNCLPPNYREALQAPMDDPSLGVCYAPLWQFEDGGRVHGFSRSVVPFDFDLLRRTNFADTCSLVRREAFDQAGGWLSNRFGLQDWLLWLRITRCGWNMRLVDTTRLLYRVHEGSMSQLRAGKHECGVEVMRDGHSVAIVTLFSGRPWVLERYFAWLTSLDWNRENLHLVAVDNSRSKAFRRKLVRALAASGLAYTIISDETRALEDVPSDSFAGSRYQRSSHAYALSVHMARLYALARQSVPSGSDLVLCVEDDVEPPHDVLHHLCLGLFKYQNAGVVAGCLRSRFEDRLIAWRSFPETRDAQGEAVDAPPAAGGFAAIAGSGFGCTLFRRQVWDGLVFRPSRTWSPVHCAFDWAAADDVRRAGFQWLLAGSVRCRHWQDDGACVDV